MGIEPTWDGSAPPHYRFEDGGRHQPPNIPEPAAGRSAHDSAKANMGMAHTGCGYLHFVSEQPSGGLKTALEIALEREARHQDLSGIREELEEHVALLEECWRAIRPRPVESPAENATPLAA